ncbi:MAG: hypothetical protein CG446_922 [Methanosaeta sp. ASO1]|nr:MAG: hypothetical protein CG446_922 [Methanosaeta sp. ASO1]
MVLAVAMLSVSALAGCDSEAVLASGIFETEESSIKFPAGQDTNIDSLSSIKFPAGQDTNIDSLEVGNDKALAYGSIFMRTPKATATNNLEIKKDQDSGACPNQCCMNTLSSSESTQAGPVVLQTANCADCYIKVNVDQIKVGNRDALAFGFSSATNDVKILATQQ